MRKYSFNPKPSKIKIYLYLALALTVTSCKPKTKEEIAKENIKEFLHEKYPDGKIYEPIEFSKIDSNYSTFFSTKRSQYLYDLHDRTIQRAELSLRMSDTYKGTDNQASLKEYKEALQLGNEVDSITDLISKESKAYQPEFIGYKVLHKYRFQNEHHAPEPMSELFILDSTFRVVKSEKRER